MNMYRSPRLHRQGEGGEGKQVQKEREGKNIYGIIEHTTLSRKIKNKEKNKK